MATRSEWHGGIGDSTTAAGLTSRLRRRAESGRCSHPGDSTAGRPADGAPAGTPSPRPRWSAWRCRPSPAEGRHH